MEMAVNEIILATSLHLVYGMVWLSRQLIFQHYIPGCWHIKPMFVCSPRVSSINVKFLSRIIKSFNKRGIDYRDKADMILIYEEAKT